MTRVQKLRQRKAELVASARALFEAATAENRSLTPDEQAKDDAIQAELDTVNADLVREERQAARERDLSIQTITPGATRVEVGADLSAERPWGPRLPDNADAQTRQEVLRAGLGEFGIAVMRAARGEGFDPRLFAAAAGMGSAVPSEGGFAVPIEIAAGIERNMFAGGELLSRVDARTISSDNIAYNVVAETSRASTRDGGVLGYWVDQGTAPTATHPTLARVEFKLRKVGALGYMTDELVADAAALGGELETMFGDELIFQVEDAITEGTGAGQPLGYLNAPCLVSVDKETGQTAATITTTNLSKMWARMPARDKANAVWLINGDCGPQLDVLSIPAGTSALEPRFVTYTPAGLMQIKGRPVVETEYNATLGTVGDIVLINLKRYRLVRKGGVEQASSMHVRFTTGEQTFRAFYRVDGAMMPRSAVTPFKGGSSKSLSPVVALATRS
jgi:HK97 family phage major capsid protein